MRAVRSRMPNRQRGGTLVEAAIALPLLALMFVATGEVGRAFMQYNTLAKTVRDGGRYLATYAREGDAAIQITAQLDSEAKNLTVYGNIAGNGAPLLPGYDPSMLNIIPEPDDEHVTLIADYPFQPVLFNTLPDFGFGGGFSLVFNMRTSVTVRAL